MFKNTYIVVAQDGTLGISCRSRLQYQTIKQANSFDFDIQVIFRLAFDVSLTAVRGSYD